MNRAGAKKQENSGSCDLFKSDDMGVAAGGGRKGVAGCRMSCSWREIQLCHT